MDSTTTTSLHTVGIGAAFLLSGISAGSSLLTLPILYRLPSATSLDIFAEFFFRGLYVVAPLSTVSSLSLGTVAYLVPSKRRILIAACVLPVGTLVWTRLVMMGGIERMLFLNENAVELGKASGSEVLALLKAWTWQNAVRAVMSGVGGSLGLYALVQ